MIDGGDEGVAYPLTFKRIKLTTDSWRAWFVYNSSTE